MRVKAQVNDAFISQTHESRCGGSELMVRWRIMWSTGFFTAYIKYANHAAWTKISQQPVRSCT